DQASPGAALTLPVTATQLGIDMDSPTTDRWPDVASGIPAALRVDTDADGRPGVTAIYAEGGGYDHPPTDSRLGAPRSDNPYVASRVACSRSGTLASCAQSSGAADFSHIDTRIYGCSLENGECSASQATFLDENCLDYTLGSGTYSLVRVADDAACAQIRAA